jgi:methylmalonyl-CoA epimerase
VKINHIGIAVANLEDALRFYKDVLGLEVIAKEEVPEEKVKVAMLKVGTARIELLEALDSESPIAKFIAKRGEGIHHIALEVDDVDEVSGRLKSMGVKLVYDKPKVVSNGSRKVQFIHPKSAHGVLIELVEELSDE